MLIEGLMMMMMMKRGRKNNFHVNNIPKHIYSFVHRNVLPPRQLLYVIIILLSVVVINDTHTNTDSLLCDFNGKMPLLVAACGESDGGGGSGNNDNDDGGGGDGGNCGNSGSTMTLAQWW